MSTINQINNLSNASAAQLSDGGSISGSSLQNSNDWFMDGAIDSSQLITATNYYETGTSIDQISQNILSFIGASSR